MKTQYLVINRETRDELILNAKEVSMFLKRKNYRDYAISRISSKKETWFEILGFAFFGLAIVILGTKIIVECL